MAFVPLTQEWGRDGAASVILAALEDAGFHPAMECDPRGWMHFYSWPFGSCAPITLWIPDAEHEDARAFLAAECEPSWDAVDVGTTFSGLVLGYRRWLYVAWFFQVVVFAALLVGIQAFGNSLSGLGDSDGE